MPLPVNVFPVANLRKGVHEEEEDILEAMLSFPDGCFP